MLLSGWPRPERDDHCCCPLQGVRDAVSLDGAPISFHRGHNEVSRPVAAAICAGAAHSSALTTTGVVLTWRSADPALQVRSCGSACVAGSPPPRLQLCVCGLRLGGLHGASSCDRHELPAASAVLQVQEVGGALTGKRVVSIAAGAPAGLRVSLLTANPVVPLLLLPCGCVKDASVCRCISQH